MGHFTATRLEFEMMGADPTYNRIVAELWDSKTEWRQIGLLAPGWLHGCLGLNYAFRHRPFWKRFQYMLFAFALLLPVLSALGFVTMARDISRKAAASPTEISAVTPEMRATIDKMHWWLGALLWSYGGLVGATFAARGVRAFVEHSRRGLITITYPNRTIKVPRGWSVLEASRAFHIPHASSCGGRARCSTCRVRIVDGAHSCPAPAADECATLERIKAEPGIRLACQLRPTGDVALSPLVLTERPDYRARPPAIESERDAVLLYCDFANRAALARDHLAHDVLFAFKRYAESACRAISSMGGTVCYVAHDSIFGLFGLSGDVHRAAAAALAVASEIELSLREINHRLGQEWGFRAEIALTLHIGRLALSNVGQSSDLIIAEGEAVEAAAAIRKALMTSSSSYAVSQAVFDMAGVERPPRPAAKVAVNNANIAVYILDTIQLAAPELALHQRIQRKAATVMDRIRG
jgi:adenylate cyclase